MKHLYDSLRGIDHYTERVLFEFKYNRNFRNPENVARDFAQIMCYQYCRAGWRGRERKSCFYKLSPLFPNNTIPRIMCRPHGHSEASAANLFARIPKTER